MKMVAIKQYRTQIEVMEPFLMGFVRKTELFATKPVISIPVTSSIPDLNENPMPHILIKTYTGGMLNEEIYKSAALTKLAGFYHDDKLYIGIESAKPISKKVIYHLEMRLFYNKPGDIRRVDLGVVNGEIYEYKRAHNSITNVIASEPIVDKNRMWIVLHLPDVRDLKYVFMGADSIYRNKLIDKIPWNMYKIGE
jgi:hypothetical protein